ncbi:hypothetical protein [Helicobacter sp. T3_23-1056]
MIESGICGGIGVFLSGFWGYKIEIYATIYYFFYYIYRLPRGFCAKSTRNDSSGIFTYNDISFLSY